MKWNRKQKAENGGQKKSEWWKFVLTAIIPILFTAAAMYYEHWRVVHSVRCSFVSATYSDDMIKVRLAFENEGTKSEVILGASFFFPAGSGYSDSESTFSYGDWDILYGPMSDAPFVIRPGEVLLKTFEWLASYKDLSRHFGNTNRFNAPISISINFLDQANRRRSKVLQGLGLGVEDINTFINRFPTEDVDLFDGENVRNGFL